MLRVQEHFGKIGGGQQAAAVTYFGFLSFFPILALAVFAVGQIAEIWPNAHDGLSDAINQVIPGLVGSGQGQIELDDVQRFSGLAGVVGLLGALYAGLGWLSATRTSLQLVFNVPAEERPGFLAGKLRDLSSLVVIGVVLFASVIAGGLVTNSTGTVLEWLGLSDGFGVFLRILTWAVGIAIDTLLFWVLFRLPARPELPSSSVWGGALLGGVAFEILKLLSTLVLGSVTGNPAFQAFGTALVLLVWINYFAQIVLYAASWAATSPAARAAGEGAWDDDEREV